MESCQNIRAISKGREYQGVRRRIKRRPNKRLDPHMPEVIKILNGHGYKKGDTGMIMDNEKQI